MNSLKRLVLALGLLAVAGCGGGARVIAWKPLRPPIAPAPPLAHPCSVADLRWSPSNLGEDGVGWVGATGNLGTSILVQNVSGHVCSLVGRPRVRFTGDVRTIVSAMPAHGDDPVDGPPLSSLRALKPGKGARIELWWLQSWCGEPPSALLVTLPDGSTKRIANDAAPRCNDPAARPTGTLLDVSRWVPLQSAPPSLPLRARLLGRVGLHHEVVFHVRRGQVLSYRVGLTNVSRRPFSFRTCPIYTVTVERTDAFVLNCRPMGVLAPGKRAVFEMRMRVSKRIGGFLWSLNAANDISDDAEVVVSR